MNKGQFTIPIVGAVAGATMLASVMTSYFTTQNLSSKEIMKVDTKAQVTETRVDNIEARLDRMENKIDLLLQKSGVNPKLYEGSN